ncbi:Uncharacterised protein [Candidatus Bartonella washoeensis]|uniref:Uncharacterized protein n=1 Tax=Candidatus Bartonella washoeensis Sb944nv TaxID=1094563 RepID=J0Q116_9HYPH|nr:hypothetical protein [Bartonella washoeensis]EJF78671.1 hypothetical protein MCQ_01050 [Bartonella washoeensis Sb944nv]SPU27190.1 Uncharacterised protein [Bartonella washoeensis]
MCFCNAEVYNYAEIFENSKIYDNTLVYGYTKIRKIYCNSELCDCEDFRNDEEIHICRFILHDAKEVNKNDAGKGDGDHSIGRFFLKSVVFLHLGK